MSVAATKPATESLNTDHFLSSPGKRTIVLSIVLAALTLLLYTPVTGNNFVNFDDDVYVLSNQHVQAGLKWETFKWAFYSLEHANWHPLTWLSHALDYELFHLSPAGHHSVNAFLHILNVLLVFLLLQSATKSTWRSLMVAALFAAHPVNVESVAWIAERKNVLCTFFFLLTLGAYGYYARKPQLGRYLAVAALFAMGLMSKPMVVTLPFVLMLLDYWPLGRLDGVGRSAWPKLVAEKVPLMLMVMGSAAITIIAQRTGGALKRMEDVSFAVRAENSVVSYVRYIGKAVWPSRLSVMYPLTTNGFPLWKVAGAVAFLLLITWIGCKLSSRRYLIVGWLFFLGTLVPVIGLIQVGEQAMADRYAYIPFLGLFVAATWGLADWASSHRIAIVWQAAVSVTVIAVFSLVTTLQIRIWHDSFSLWSHALAVTDNNFVAENNMGQFLADQGSVDEAIAHFERAVRINPSDPIANLNIGVFHQKRGNFDQAIARYRAVLQLTSGHSPMRSAALRDLGMIHRQLDDYPHARQDYESCLRLNPADASCLVGAGLVDQKTGHLEAAINEYARAVALEPTDVRFLLLAQALAATGRLAESQLATEKAQQISLDLDRAQANLRDLLQ